MEQLTKRELEVLRLRAAGSTTRSIAQELVVVEGSAKRYINNILRNLDAHSCLEAVARARAVGLIT